MFLARLRYLVLLTTASAVGMVVAINPPRHASAPASSVLPSGGDDNAAVEPGLVCWHASFAEAQSAAQQSGKPVLLFHMMGQLDRQFC